MSLFPNQQQKHQQQTIRDLNPFSEEYTLYILPRTREMDQAQDLELENTVPAALTNSMIFTCYFSKSQLPGLLRMKHI